MKNGGGTLKKFVSECMYSKSIIAVPDDIGINIKKYLKSFYKWIYNKDNNHGYWVFIDGKKRGVSFDVDAFIKYLNLYHLQDSEEKAIIVEEEAVNVPLDIPVLFF